MAKRKRKKPSKNPRNNSRNSRKKPFQPINPSHAAYVLESLWNSPDATEQQNLEIGDGAVTMLVELADSDHLRSITDPGWAYLVDTAFLISCNIHRRKALELAMQYLQRYIQLDINIIKVALRWLDHLTGFHGLEYPDGGRIVSNVMAKYLPCADEHEMTICAFAARTLLRWECDGDEILHNFKKGKQPAQTATLLMTTLKWQPIVPKHKLKASNDFLSKALVEIGKVNPVAQETIRSMYSGEHSFVDYTVLDEEEKS